MKVREIPSEFEGRHQQWLANHEKCAHCRGEVSVPCICGPEPCRGCGEVEEDMLEGSLCSGCFRKYGVVEIDLSRNQALVLFDFLSRFCDSDELTIEHEAEQRILWDVAALLEKALVEPLQSDYLDLLQGAREAVRNGVKGSKKPLR